MKGTYHMMFGAITGIVIMIIIQYITKEFWSLIRIFEGIVISAFLGIFPDIDHKLAHITWFMMGSGLIIEIVGLIIQNTVIHIIGLIIVASVYLSAMFLKHRGLTHTLPFMLVAPMLFLGPLLFLGFKMDWGVYASGVGAGFSHIACDKWKILKKIGRD